MKQVTAKNSAVPFEVYNTAATAEEIARVQAAYEARIMNPAGFPVSFRLDGKPYCGFASEEFEALPPKTAVTGEKRMDTLAFRHSCGLTFTVEAALYARYAEYEWTVHVQNTDGARNSPQISGLMAADLAFSGAAPVLSGILGDARSENHKDEENPLDYGMNNQPYIQPLEPRTVYTKKCEGGCGSNYEFPYMYLDFADNGLILAIGWPGQWAASFENTGDAVRVRVGQEYLDTFLQPGESIRSPLAAFLFHDGTDPDRTVNLWRHFHMDCNMPRRDGHIMLPVLGGTSVTTDLAVHATEDNQIAQIQFYHEHGLDLDNWWLDAGWYYTDYNGGVPEDLDDYGREGNWVPRTEDFPTGFRAISDCLGEWGGNLMVWFEPERCGLHPSELREDGSTLKPEWLLNDYQEFRLDKPWGTLVLPASLVNIGNEDAYRFLKAQIFKVIEQGRIGIYREDHNIRPLNGWLKTDGEHRLGFTENRYITAHLRLWDELREHFGDMYIDSCASGGRRNDLETMRRAVPLFLSDFFGYDLTKRQSVHQSILKWFPYFSAGGPTTVGDGFGYAARSAMAPWTRLRLDTSKENLDMETVHRYVEEWRAVNRLFYADYYPVLDWNIDEDKWIGYELVDSVRGEGFLELYRRPEAGEEVKCVRLKGLCPEKRYELHDWASGKTEVLTGRQLMTEGYAATIAQQPGATTVQFSVCGDEAL